PRETEESERFTEESDRHFMTENSGSAECRDRTETSELEREAREPIPDGPGGVDHEDHRDGVADVLRSRKSGRHQREPGGHEHHQVAGTEGPRHVDADSVVYDEDGDLSPSRPAPLLPPS